MYVEKSAPEWLTGVIIAWIICGIIAGIIHWAQNRSVTALNDIFLWKLLLGPISLMFELVKVAKSAR